MTDRYVLVRPGTVFKYAFDWATDYLPEGVSIDSRQWSITPSGPTLANDTTGTVTVTFTTAHAGQVYELSEDVVMSNAESDIQSITLRCEAL